MKAFTKDEMDILANSFFLKTFPTLKEQEILQGSNIQKKRTLITIMMAEFALSLQKLKPDHAQIIIKEKL